MPLPLLLVPALVALTTGGGLGTAGAGGHKLVQARRVIRDAEASQAPHLEAFHTEVGLTREELAAYGELKYEIDSGSLQRLRDYITTQGRAVDPAARNSLEDLVVELPDLDDPETIRMTQDYVKSALGSVAAGAGARTGVLALVAAYGAASTGTPIATLSGAAASNATLAFLGGGALAAGGGGIAAGTLMLAGVTVAPGVLIAGVTLLIKGERSKTAASEFAAKVAVHNETIDALCAEQPVIRARTGELFDVAATLDGLLRDVLDDLEDLTLDDPAAHPVFSRAILLATTLSKHLAIPVLTTDGHLNPETRSHTNLNPEGLGDQP